MIILVTGSSGQVGKSFQKIANKYKEVKWHFVDRNQLDITDKVSVFKTVNALCPDYIINCAAYTAVDKAESEPEKAYLINDTAVGYLAEAAIEVGGTLIHYSSDYVYHNGQNTPIKETDPKQPKGVYAQSKLAGEQKIVESNVKAIVIRTSWVYSEFGNNFLITMLRLGKERDSLSIVNDQIGCPTYATDIAEDTMNMIAKYPFLPERIIVINYTANGEISWFDFAKKIFEYSNINILLRPIPSSNYPTPAARPLNSILDLSHYKEAFDLKIRNWSDSLKTCYKIM